MVDSTPPSTETAGAHPRRKPLHPDITEALIEQVVRGFYARIRLDPVLGPIFAAVIGDDWEPHLSKLVDFWSSMLCMTGRYKGNPMAVHRRLDGIKPEHFERWLALFRETARGLCTEEPAALFIERAERIAESLQLSMFFDPRNPGGFIPVGGKAS